MIALYKALVTALLDVLDWILLVWVPSFEIERLLYLLASDPHLDCVYICILHTSPHAMTAWISH